MKIKINIALPITMVMIFAVSCNPKAQTDKFDYGTYENGKYTNTFFNLEMTLSADWDVFSQEENANLTSKIGKTSETSGTSTIILLTASQYGLETIDNAFNPNIMLLADNLNGLDRVKLASDYLLFIRKTLEQDPAPKVFPFASFRLEKINNIELAHMRVINNITENSNYTQDYYISIQNGFALSFVLTYDSETQHQLLKQVLSTLKHHDEISAQKK